MSCPLSACKVCTGCAHSRHDQCRQTVRCPDTDAITVCGCCGDIALAARELVGAGWRP